MKAMSHPLKDLFAELAGAGMVGMRTTAIGEPKPFDLLMAYVGRAAMSLIVLGALAGAAHQIGQMALPDQGVQITTDALAEAPGQARTLDDILAESGEEEGEAFGFARETDSLPMALLGPDASPETESAGTDGADIGSLIARLNRQARTLTMIDEAAARVGAPARLMRAMAGLESGLDATARASTSSATGLYQFIEATWLSKVESDGHKYGLGRLARHIRRGPLDEPIVDDLRIRDQILALRKDARLSAYLAAELTVDNTRRLEKLLGRPVTETEIYLSHVFGVTAAARFLRAAQSTPDRIGAWMFPKEARANPGIFKISGNPATLGEIRKRFTAKMARIDLPDLLATIDSLVPAQEAMMDQNAELVQVADWRDRKGEEQIAASAVR
jgi:hypothetical protein